MTALVDTRSQISALTEGVCNERGLRIIPLRNLMEGSLHLEGMRDITIPYKGYVEANLIIPDLPHYNEDVLFLVVANHKYWDRVAVQIGTQVIDQLVAMMTKKELLKVGETWRQVHLSTTVSKATTESLNDYGGKKR